MSHSVDLSTADGVLTYVAETQFDSHEASPVTGGSGNYTFRLYLRTPYKGHATIILKHAKPYVPGMKTLAFSLDRQVGFLRTSLEVHDGLRILSSPQIYEVAALRKMKDILPDDSLVTVPDVFLFDDVANVIIMSDCGEHILTLKQQLVEDPPGAAVAGKIGAAVGEFVGRLHTLGQADQEYREFFSRNEDGKKLSVFATYGRLVSTLADHTLPALSDPPFEVSQSELDTIAQIAADTERDMLTTTETVVMGDLWPGNILVALRRDAAGTAMDVERIYVVDWELAKTGLAGLDVGQFAAELHLLCSFKAHSEQAATSVLVSFLNTYRERYEDGGSLRVARTAVVHLGAHLVTWTPRVQWGSEEIVRKIVREGVGYLVSGCSATEDYIRETKLAGLLS